MQYFNELLVPTPRFEATDDMTKADLIIVIEDVERPGPEIWREVSCSFDPVLGRTKMTKCTLRYYEEPAECAYPVLFLHEMGHVLGLSHDSIPGSIMNEQALTCNSVFTDRQFVPLREIYTAEQVSQTS
jgi:hypothetical protein